MQTSDSLQKKFEAEMKQSGLRITHVRQELFDVLGSSDTPLSIQQLVHAAKNAHFVSVYRSVDALYGAGVVRQIPRGFKNLYELSDTYRPHHHHATCETCNKSVSIHDHRLEELLTQLTTEKGLTPTKHTFELFGICVPCKKLRKPH